MISLFSRQPHRSVALASFLIGVATLQRKMVSTTSAAAATSFYGLSAVTNSGDIQPMADFKGKVVYATNVASQ